MRPKEIINVFIVSNTNWEWLRKIRLTISRSVGVSRVSDRRPMQCQFSASLLIWTKNNYQKYFKKKFEYHSYLSYWRPHYITNITFVISSFMIIIQISNSTKVKVLWRYSNHTLQTFWTLSSLVLTLSNLPL